jgi:hypothetical protein
MNDDQVIEHLHQHFDGYIEESAEEVNSDKCSIRPVFWLKL